MWAAEPIAEAQEAQSEAPEALEAQPRSLLAGAGARREGTAALASDLLPTVDQQQVLAR